MKTQHLKMDLIMPEQINKEVFFNENLCILDSFSNISVHSFVPAINEDCKKNTKYIIAEGVSKNKIAFCPSQNKNWKFIDPAEGMILFCYELKQLVYFDGDEWVFVDESRNFTREVGDAQCHFESARGVLLVTKALSYIYLDDDCELVIESPNDAVVEIIIKQNHQNIFNIKFSSNILWASSTQYQPPTSPNAINYLRFIRLPETCHYLCSHYSNEYVY